MTTTIRFDALPRILAAVLAVVATLLMAGLAPEPDPVPRRWELGLNVGDLRLATVEVPGVGTRRYYVLTYRVVNTSGEDQLFAPIWELSTGRGPVARSGRDVPMAVTRALMDASQNQFIEDQVSIVGQILQGEDNAKDGIVIWPATETDIERLTIYAAGFSGETATVLPPGAKEKTVLRKSLMLDYVVPGNIQGWNEPFEVREKRWIMR